MRSRSTVGAVRSPRSVAPWTCCACPNASPPAFPDVSASRDRPVVPLVRLHGVITPTAGPGPRSVINSVTTEKVLERAFSPRAAGRRRAAGQLARRLAHAVGAGRRPHPRAGRRARGAGARLLRGRRRVRGLLAGLRGRRDLRRTRRRSSARSGWSARASGSRGCSQRIGVERRLYTAGEAKSRLDPFLPEKPEDVVWLRGLQDQLHAMFRDWVVARRGDRLATGGRELFDGEVWTGARALELGLVDGLGTARARARRALPRRRAGAGRGAPAAARAARSGAPRRTITSRSCRGSSPRRLRSGQHGHGTVCSS